MASIYSGPSNANDNKGSSFDEVYQSLTQNRPYPVLPCPSPNPHDSGASHRIAELHVHPVLEAILHILNNDLPSAHFLCRHMENRPAFEAMYTHGILHRIEGDYRNAEAWYNDVAESEVFQSVWSSVDDAVAFIKDVEKLRKQKIGNLDELESQSGREIKAMVSWCRQKFGTDKVIDATKVWVDKPEKTKEMAEEMLVGGEGWRQF